MVYTINQIKEKAIPLTKKHGVESLSLFGSYARGEADENSDLDFYIDDRDIRNLLQYCSFVHDLEDAFNCHVGVVSTGIKDKDFLSKISREGLLIYKR